MPTRNELPLLSFASARAFTDWLHEHHAKSPGVWVKIAKAESGVSSVTYPEALDAALCYGWIDGQKGAIDATHWRQRFTPRTSRSKWSKINCAKVEALVAQGRMQPAGLREVEAARADGRWEQAYAGQKSIEVPDDLRDALARNKRAKAFFDTLDRANRYSILYRVQEAKKPETRARRIEKLVAMCAAGEKIHP